MYKLIFICGILYGFISNLRDKAKNLTCIIITKEKSDFLNTKPDQSEWRRSKVVELRARGMTHDEIALDYKYQGPPLPLTLHT